MKTERLGARAENAPAAVVERLVGLACLAPSVHNTQPWKWRYADGVLELYADLSRLLPEEDRRGRNLTISCGGALHHLQFAARALGWETEVDRLPLGAPESLLARIRVHRGEKPVVVRADIDLMNERCTDRRRFTAWPVTSDRLEAMCRRTAAWGVRSEVVAGDAARLRLELLTNRALSVLEFDGGRLREQDEWVGRNGTDGVPLHLLPDDPDPLQARSRFRPGLLEDTRMVIRGSDRVLALGGVHDDVGSWLRTGEAMSDLWLEATRDGVSVVPVSQPMEVESVRREIARSVLARIPEPHLLLRVGWQAIGRRELPRTPRRPLAEVLEIL